MTGQDEYAAGRFWFMLALCTLAQCQFSGCGDDDFGRIESKIHGDPVFDIGFDVECFGRECDVGDAGCEADAGDGGCDDAGE